MASTSESTPGLNVPVVFIVFNRPDTTEIVFQAIRAARPRRLLVVADGPRADVPGEAALCRRTRDVIRGVDWDCQVLTDFPKQNLGLRRRFQTAFDWVFAQVEEAIILEHDCVPHPSFFLYCAELLERYRHDERIVWIGGTNPMREWPGEGSYLFNRINWVWGWATWRRAWRGYDVTIPSFPLFERSSLARSISPHRRIRRGFRAVMDLAWQGKWPNWDIQATFQIWSRNGIAIHPRVNLVSNIGFDEQATNTVWTNDPLANLPRQPLGSMVHPREVVIDHAFDLATYRAHMVFMDRIARFRRLRTLPFYDVARRSLRRLSRARGKRLLDDGT